MPSTTSLRVPEIEDIVISGGDVYQLAPKSVTMIGDALLAIPHIRRMRFATKGPAVMPMKILTDRAWTDAIGGVVEKGRRMGKDVVLHTHFNNPNEISWITQQAMQLLFERGITVRNQSVLIRGVNDDAAVMQLLVRRLGYLNVHAYYVYMHDLVKGVEDLRTSVQTALDIEKFVRGSTAGFNTPTFICDAPGGGGKRDVHSFDYYDRENGIAVYSAPSVKPGKHFVYFDPIDTLEPDCARPLGKCRDRRGDGRRGDLPRRRSTRLRPGVDRDRVPYRRNGPSPFASRPAMMLRTSSGLGKCVSRMNALADSLGKSSVMSVWSSQRA